MNSVWILRDGGDSRWSSGGKIKLKIQFLRLSVMDEITQREHEEIGGQKLVDINLLKA